MKLIITLILGLLATGCACTTEQAFRTVWEKYVSKTTNWILADNEASKYKDREEAARAYLRELRALSLPSEISAKLVRDGFHWDKENIDFTSYPWVTIARRRGDCDDFMCLWEAIFKYRPGRTKRVIVSSKSGSAHAMLLYYNNKLYLLSNQYLKGTGVVGDEEKLIKSFYGDKTRCWITY